MAEPGPHAIHIPGATRVPDARQDRPPTLRWEAPGIVNLRGNPLDAPFQQAVQTVLGVALPPSPGGIAQGAIWRVVAVGPDDWFLIGPAEASAAMIEALARALTGQHVALTDVGSGYRVLHLGGAQARDRLAQGCPLDLHPRVFGEGRCAGSHFFKAAVWLWRAGDGFDLLVRRSFQGYVRLMLEQGDAASRGG